MKIVAAVSAALFSIINVDAEIVLHGAVKNGESYILSLSDTETAASRWVAVGGEIGGFVVTAYDAERGEVKLKRGDVVVGAMLSKSQVTSERLEVRDILAMSDVDLEVLGFYRVKAGDTGAKIARTMQITVGDLLALNPDVTFSRLKVGQILVIAAPRELNQKE